MLINKKSLSILIFIFLFFLSVNTVRAASCPFIDGGYGDDDGAVNGTVYMNHTEAITINSSNQGQFTCNTFDILHIGSSGYIDITRTLDVYEGLVLTVSNIVVDGGGKIDLDAQGYVGSTEDGVDGEGPGGGGSNSAYGCGGSGGTHGDLGGKGDCSSPASSPNDLVYQPTILGSGGGKGRGGNGNAGGGYLKIITNGNATINGELTADGGYTPNTYTGSGGAGGSIWLLVNGNIGGSGTISADGGENRHEDTGSGGGGRILIEYTGTENFTGSVHANAGIDTNNAIQQGADGTVLYKDITNNKLVTKNTQRWQPLSATTWADWFPNIDVLLVDSGELKLDSLNKDQASGGIGWNIALSDIEISAGAYLSADSMGYLGGVCESYSGCGPGGGGGIDYTGKSGSGGTHGGVGGDGDGTVAVTAQNGLVYAPTELGSGAGWGRSGYHHGGGAIKITVSGDATINGELTADGGYTPNTYTGAGGAGGSIWLIVADNIGGSGAITADGGENRHIDAGAGGGGRILIEYTENNYNFTGTVHADEGIDTDGGTQLAEYGSVLYKDNTNNKLTIRNTQRWVPTSTTSWADWFPSITTLHIDSQTLLLDSINKDQTSGGTGWDIELDDVIIDADTALSADSMGYFGGVCESLSGCGPGGGGGINYTGKSGAGGTHGGLGGDGDGALAALVTNGSASAPTEPGSGAGWGRSGYNDGGGAIKLTVNNSIIINGELTADGGYTPDTYNGAGGAGGSIWLISRGTMSGSGAITADGGENRHVDAGAGGGGRIFVAYASNTFSGNIHATGGVDTNSVGQAGDDGSDNSTGIPYFISVSPLVQYTNDGLDSVIAVGGKTGLTSIKLSATVIDPDSTDTLSLDYEVKQIGTTFNSQNLNNDSLSWSLSTYPTGQKSTVVESSLVDLATYKWRVRVCDNTSYCSDWFEYGDNDQTDTDFYVNLNTAPSAPNTFGPNRITDENITNDNTPSFQFTLDDPNTNDQVRYQIQIDDNANFSSPIIDYYSEFDDEGSRSFSVGQAVGTGATGYITGSQGQTLADGTYYWQVKTYDDDDSSSDFASPTNPSFLIDTVRPNNATNLVMKKTSSLESLITADDGKKWTNNLAPYFSWTEAVDVGSSIKGYCLYLGTDSQGDPKTAKGLLGSSDPTLRIYNDCQFVTTDTSISFSDVALRGDTWLTDSTSPYYFKVVALDNADNNFNGENDSNVFTFYYDSTSPTNVSSISAAGGTFSNIDDMYISWPETSSLLGASDSISDVFGYQYSLNSQSNWTGITADSSMGINYIPVDTTQPFNFSTERDEDRVSVGDNLVYFRTIDKAGNISSSSTYRTASVSFGGDAPSFAGDAIVTVTPSTNTENNYSLSWSSAIPAENRTITTYYYMINTNPPATRAILENSSSTYISSVGTSIAIGELPNLHKDSNTVYVVAVDDLGNYSPSNYISATFTLDSDFPDAPKNLVVSDASLKSASLWRASLAWEQPDYIGTGNLLFTIQRSLDGSQWSTISTTSGYAYVDTVTDSKQYYWRVGSSDNGDESIASPTYSNGLNLTPKGSYTQPASLTSDPVASSITTKRATLTWTTSRTSDSKIAYGTSTGDYFDEEPSNSTHLTDHTINLINLTPGTTYYYKAKWTDEDGNTGQSDEETFTTSAAPIVKDVEAKYISISSAILEFTTKGASTAKIYYGTSTSFGGLKEITTSPLETTYNTELTGLQDGEKYYYQINTFDSEGDEYEGTILNFETLPRPRLTNIQVQQVDNSAQPTLVLTWQSNTAVSSIVAFYPESTPDLLRDEVDVELVKGEHQLILKGLLPNTKYLLNIKGQDKVGNEAESDTISFTTATDTRAPKISKLEIQATKLNGFDSNGDSSIQLVVSWDTDEPATSQVEYGEGTGIQYSQLSQEDSSLSYNHVVVVAGLSPSRVYHLRSISKDVQGNQSKSIDRIKITPTLDDNAFNLVINNLREVFGFMDIFKY